MNAFSLTAVWLRRASKVTRRRGQIWDRRSGSSVETFIVIGEPAFAEEYYGGNAFVRQLANAVNALGKRGWTHEVFCLENGKQFHVNELWFSDAELGGDSTLRRIA
jgi:hypothetical protein